MIVNTDKILCSIGCGEVGQFYSKREKRWRCCKYTGGCPGHLAKRQATFDIKYNGNPMKNKAIAKKCWTRGKETLTERYGVDNPSQIPGVAMDIAVKRRATLKKKYGVEFPLQIAEANEQSKKTRKQTLNEKYGIKNIMEINDIRIKAYTNLKLALLEKYNVTNPMDIPGIPELAAERAQKAKKKYNKKQNLWLDSLGVIDEHREMLIYLYDKRFIIADGYNKSTKTIYEFYGDYWHGNPKVFDQTKMNKSCKKTFGELYEGTMLRKQRILKSGYNIIEIWEADWNKLKT